MKIKISIKSNKRFQRALLKVNLIFIFFILIGCVSVPKQAPSLSEELGNKIKSIQDSHVTLLETYFESKRNDVDKFVMEVWAPAFAKELFNLAQIKEAWNIVLTSDNDTDKLKFLTIVGPAMQLKINEKRLELVKPLDALERDLKSKIINEYDIAYSINNTLTSFLYSASKVNENRDRYLSMLGVTDEKVDSALEETSNAVNTLIGYGNLALKNQAKITEYLDKINEIKNKLKNK